jgi:hypothetical protein
LRDRILVEPADIGGLLPTAAAVSVIVTPSASSKIIRLRLVRPAGMAVDRCHAKSVLRSGGVRRIVRELLRPRGIKRPLQKKYHYISCRQNGCVT